MRFLYKQLLKQIVKNRIFVSLLFLLTILTSLSYYFVIFSIDGNLAELNALTTLTENQQLYKNALVANTLLAYTFFIATVGLTSFVFVMYFYRFYRENKKTIGCIKAIGFRDSELCTCLVIFVAELSMIGAVLGLIGGYFLSDVMIRANTKTYLVSGLIKGISPMSFFVGIVVSTAIFCFTTFFSYSFVRGKESGVLIMGNGNYSKFSFLLKAANYISDKIPIKNKFPLRLALRKPISICLILVAVLSFNVCIILGQSLNRSSQKVYDSQMVGHNYEYDTKYSEYQTEGIDGEVIPYVENIAKVHSENQMIEQTVTCLNTWNNLYELKNYKGDILNEPVAGDVYINANLHETYGLDIGDSVVVDIAGVSHEFIVADIATNAKTDNIYLNTRELTEILSISSNAYNGVLSLEKVNGGIVTTKEQKIDMLNREAVSNESSAVINQLIGGLVGAILIFLALYVNFQDNTHDMLILNMLGYQTKHIRKMLVDIYMPIVWSSFFLTLIPSIILARLIQKSFSISTRDYMPFGISIFVVVLLFVGLNIIYRLVQELFGFGIKTIIAKKKIMEYLYSE